MVEAKLKYDNLTENEKYFGHEKYREFKELVWSVHHPDTPMPDLDHDATNRDDDEVVIAATKKSVKCPLTTTWLDEPVTSKLCKHTFSKNAIFGLIRRSGDNVVECPMPGCRKTLTKSIFYEDTIMERMVTKAKEAEGLDDRSQVKRIQKKKKKKKKKIKLQLYDFIYSLFPFCFLGVVFVVP
ncbi:zinc-finger of the MIZ type in Nse subunit-domain-containing protein [Absidia repens]|uniref:Zinc-finger of the MIZ type in Nse subunit-domain-containing protein n=1 Tax=Absidia repens TaxID=90262 RepID=A0A1X2IIU9_9FUNG|nr:zinc-finger of the MIZ type in Nse subunit-domain-containing protein [Absidia repens]